MRFKLSILVSIISIFGLFSQYNPDAEKVTNQLLSSFKTSAIKTNFKLSVTEKIAVNSQSFSGSFVLKANKFMLDMNDTKVWFDGKTQWALSISSNEVSITEPSLDELATINPMAIINSFKARSFINFSKLKSAQNQIIDLTPKNKKEEFTKVEIQINKTSGNLVSVTLNDKKGNKNKLQLTNYQKGLTIADDYFVFNKSKYKNVTINDLR